MHHLNIVDVEATCWEGEPPAGETSEIIEIGVCVVDTLRWERVARHRILVRPTRSRVSSFCTDLTGLAQSDVDSGLSFADACEQLRKELRSDSRAWASWGDYDRKQFERQCAASAVAYPFSVRHTNLKARFSEILGLRKRLGMAQALAHLNLPLEGRHHRGDDDAWNIGAIAIELPKRSGLPESPRLV
ncbi:MAG TPA: DNA polymerase III [Micromonosporaceae bacterium]|nr:DNA polymerase III [Micromonosporaceae bacterium]HCU49165.1 DNA polymerase III [Micromonosporaceae bacterium]